MTSELHQFLSSRTDILIQQVKEWGEILTDFETNNKYEVLDIGQNKVGYMAEEGKGLFYFLKKQVLRSHRPLRLLMWNNQNEILLTLERPFFFFFSDMTVSDGGGKILGIVKRRWGILYKKYDLTDSRGQVFGHIRAPVWRLWTFPILDKREQEVGVVKKNWGGILKEVFSDADRFAVKLPDWELDKKAVALACALAVDLDFFEDNHRN